MRDRTYSGMLQFHTFEERFDYLALRGGVGQDTFSHDRYLNQRFYQSSEWKSARRDVISRENGMDLGLDGYPIFDKPMVHHMIRGGR